MSTHAPQAWPIIRDYMGRIESIGPIVAAGTAADDTDLETWLNVSDPYANLCAAAPDLLAALRECITIDDGCSSDLLSVAFLRRRLDYISEIARAAIAKATGESC